MIKYLKLMNGGDDTTIFNEYYKKLNNVKGIDYIGFMRGEFYYKINNQLLRKYKLAILYENYEFKEISDILFNKKFVQFLNELPPGFWSTSGVSGSSGTQGTTGVSGVSGFAGTSVHGGISIGVSGVSGSVGMSGCSGT